NLTGERTEPPLHPGYSLADLVTGLTGAFGIMLALESRHQTGRGQFIDLALYEPLFRMIEWQIPFFAELGMEASRNGSEFPFGGAFTTSVCATKDDHYLVLSAATREMLGRLRALMHAERAQGKDSQSNPDLVTEIRQWVSARTLTDALRELDEGG